MPSAIILVCSRAAAVFSSITLLSPSPCTMRTGGLSITLLEKTGTIAGKRHALTAKSRLRCKATLGTPLYECRGLDSTPASSIMPPLARESWIPRMRMPSEVPAPSPMGLPELLVKAMCDCIW